MKLAHAGFFLLLSSLSSFSCSSLGSSDDSYYALRATVTTGKEGSDGDVSLCFTVNGSEKCQELSSDHNDFEANQTDRFDISLSPRIAHGTKFTGFKLKYTTGLSLGDSWEVSGLRISLYYADKQEEVVCDAKFSQNVSGGAVVAAPGCP